MTTEQEHGLKRDDAWLHHAIELRAYRLWEERGGPWGTPETDWFLAEQQLAASRDSAGQESPAVSAAKVVGAVLGSVAGAVSAVAGSLTSG